MDPRVSKFLTRATIPMLRDKLKDLGLKISGNKPELIIRLEDAVKSMTVDQINAQFSQVDFSQSESSSSQSNETLIENDESDIDDELKVWRDRVKKKQEIIQLKAELARLSALDETSATNGPCFNFKDIEESIPIFDGDSRYNIKMWVQQFEDAAETLGWNDKCRFVYSRRLLGGTAKLYLRTLSVKTWKELKTALIQEFDQKVSAAEIHNELRKRKKKVNETYQQYLFNMQEIASSIEIVDSDLIQYIIDGINDTISNKIILYNANTIQDLKTALLKYEKMKQHYSHPISDNREQKSYKEKGNNMTLKCYNCNQPGHVSTKCPKPRRERGSCFKCGKMGHKIKECKEKNINAVGKTSVNSVSTQNYHLHSFEHFINYTFERNDNQATYESNMLTLLESGSPISLGQEQFLPSCVIKRTDPANYNYCGIYGSRLDVVGLSNVKIYFNNFNYNLEMYVVKDYSMMYPVILGRNFMKQSNLELRKKNENDCMNKTHIENAKEQEIEGVDETNCSKVEDLCSPILLDCGKEDFLKQILCIDINDNNPESRYNINVNSNLPYEIQCLVREIVSPACVILNKDKVIGQETDFEMEIKVTDEKPFYCTPRRLPYIHKVELEKILNDLLQRGIIRESCSPYSSPIVLVKKKKNNSNELRLCVDYRQLNKITIRDNFPLPLIEDHLDQLRNKKYFSVLDLKSGFHHVKVAENSVKYTSFITPLGQYEYCRMPFGLKNAPAIFEKFMKKIFKPLISTGKVLSYIDDLLIATESINEHIEILKQVVDIVVENSLELRLDKCSLLQEEIVYLGYKVTYQGIHPNEENLKAIRDFPLPNYVKTLQSFLGLASYFRKFIKDFATIAKPRYDLVRKNKKFTFEKPALEAFETLKSKLLDSPVLAIYNPNSETQLHCDASAVGYGAILMQKQNDEKYHPVAYFSKRASEPEKNYHSYELETLSIIYALRRFHVYLLGIKFKIVTDCQALTLTLNKKHINPRISRWSLELQNYDYIIGSKMVHADAL